MEYLVPHDPQWGRLAPRHLSLPSPFIKGSSISGSHRPVLGTILLHQEGILGGVLCDEA